jgi:hypothetical protein
MGTEVERVQREQAARRVVTDYQARMRKKVRL